MRIIVGSNVSHWCHSIGHFDTIMSYILGLQLLGHEVYAFDDVPPEQCFDTGYNPVKFEEWQGIHCFELLAKSYKIWPRCCLIYNYGEHTYGMSFSDAVEVAKTSDLLLNIGGHLKTPEIIENVRCRVFIDQVPAQTHLHHTEYNTNQGFNQHEYFFTVGLNIGTPKCDIPTGSLPWYPLVPPVVLELWPSLINAKHRYFTTISTWDGQQTCNFMSRYSGEKADNWRMFIALPKKTPQKLEVALKIDPACGEDRRLLEEHGWVLVDPRQLHILEDYRQYIANSRAEFSIAHNHCVEFNTGWFGDRSARYLASGKPVLVQATGIEGHLPVGKGLLTFTTLEEAVAGIETINSDYVAHCREARAIAEEYCDSDKVLVKMLRQIGLE